ncbi:MAG TPA: DNA repair protein RecO [Pseudoxanthomonas sp.]|nr:DNA repair protein RecO [Pseudoxanthomonas sp.]
MRITAEAAYVLHARAWRESSLLVEVLCEHHGRLGLVARGVQGPKKHVLRAALQPLQHIRLDAVLRGELANLVTAEALDTAPRLGGEATLAAFYVNELVMRLAQRQDPQQALYGAYAMMRLRLGTGDSLAWTLRRFERDLLDAIGSGFDLSVDGEGAGIDPAARYILDPEQGPQRLLSDRGRDQRRAAATGTALLALAHDRQPDADDLASLRLALRSVLGHHLGGRGLKSWEMLGGLNRMNPRDPSSSAS